MILIRQGTLATGADIRLTQYSHSRSMNHKISGLLDSRFMTKQYLTLPRTLLTLLRPTKSLVLFNKD